MEADLAREIIAQALEDETYEGDIPDDDDKAVEVAEGLVVMAKDAWEQNIQGPEVEAILKLAERDTNGDKPAAKKPGAKPAAKRPAKKEPEPEPDPEPEADSRASEEPWEDYDKDAVKEVVEGLEVWAEDEEFDSVQHILVYELAHKNRKKIVERANELLPEDMQIVEGSAEPEPDPEPEPEDDEPSATATEPYDGYDESKVSEIKEALNEYLEDEDTDDEEKLATLQRTYEYEAVNKTRTGLLDYLDDKMSSYKEQEGDGDEEGASAEEGEAEGAAASADDSGDEEGAEGGEGDGEDSRPAAGKRSRSGSASKAGSAPQGDDAEHTELLETVHELIARERLHIPPQIESEPVELPFDLTTVGDKELQQLFSAFTAYSYRSGYLLMLEEASEHKCKEAADEIVEAYVAASETDATLTKVKAEAEQHDEVKKWRKRQQRHGILAMSLRKDRDNYDRVCERLSRIETMRQDEWQRAGGGPTAKSRPGAK